MLTDKTLPFRRTGRIYPNDQAQVIYETAADGDYCRETAPFSAAATHQEAAAWAQRNFDRTASAFARKAVTAFRIEWF